ncbi:DEAD-domain-containing protein [Epithele typhae]|uniref:DEAD-domain-containing protein n=1 Tax=Epithele typhae TaxID=378194 RepID=UPI0020075C35|nr:DEAD-domain-containing protein [Epithele typhae]KAH9941181.1 DEAD-domain-containing protein [Epithele typhae]
MAASLRIIAGSLTRAASICRLPHRVPSLYALRTPTVAGAGRLSAVRFNSTVAESMVAAMHSSFSEPAVPPPEHSNSEQPLFSSLEGKISPQTLNPLVKAPFNFKHMSAVQAAVLPLLPELVQLPEPDAEKKGPRDLLVKARTGTGKTLGFLIPAVESRVNELNQRAEQIKADTASRSLRDAPVLRGVQAHAKATVGTVILSPTRELASQIAVEAQKLTKDHNFGVHLMVGGVPKGPQLRQWNMSRRDIIVGTPGRIRDYIENQPGFREALGSTSTFILDEADRLLEMGFREDIEAIAQDLKPTPERQTFLFSATMDKSIQQVAREILSQDHTFINCVSENEEPTHHHIPQHYTVLPGPQEQIHHVFRLIGEDQLANPGTSKVLVFLSTNLMVKLFSTLFYGLRPALPADRDTKILEIHGLKAQKSRDHVSKEFRFATSPSVLFTSDVSARGVDYPGVTRVIQVSVPSSRETYVHRIGRTGRGNSLKGRGDLVLLPWEAGIVRRALEGIPLKELPIEAQKEDLTKLVEEHDANIRPRQTPMAPIFDPTQIDLALSKAQSRTQPEDVSSALLSQLAFYASNWDFISRDRNLNEEALRTWAHAIHGEPIDMRMPRMHSSSRQSAPKSYRREGRDDREYRREPDRGSRRDRDFSSRDDRDYRGTGRRLRSPFPDEDTPGKRSRDDTEDRGSRFRGRSRSSGPRDIEHYDDYKERPRKSWRELV